MIPVFDGHNDFLQRMIEAGPARDRLWLDGDGTGCLDLPRIRAGGFIGGFFAIWIPSAPDPAADTHALMKQNPPFALPLPPEVPLADALPHALALTGQLMAMERTGTLSICKSAAEIRAAMAADRIAAILHIEGAEPIADLDALHLWHAMGLRSLGPVWSRPTRYGHGVPFAFPSSPDTGPGLTDAGKALVRECNRLRIILDLSHLNEKGFDDVARLSDAPLVASHSCAHAVSPSSRNLTDRQLRAIADSAGLVGLNYAIGFLHPQGSRAPMHGFEIMLRHLDHLLGILGEDGVALGSDFDGAEMPADLADASALQALIQAMLDHGYGRELTEKIAFRNWLGVLERSWGG
ncbi:dipeptidase AC. Metallo peptidase. MEROPS family M19 [Paracoccus halophilus]|uniref:Peptidase n=1 Tax=Paracoccus halophilus TaxID=376733 RepID=A0A099F6V8_9RHOB|nr:dipeptidase [Paracoccus halophilus]KGJ06214.1 peptidase [Paracoccus halophilus]SFA45700.1 dipeptidase AC. Metallo peptidase. MEROPS family M19 [Paracoccus halophilus]